MAQTDNRIEADPMWQTWAFASHPKPFLRAAARMSLADVEQAAQNIVLARMLRVLSGSSPMKFNVQIRGDVPNSFPRKSGEKVNERLLTCIDTTPDGFLADSFEVLATNLPFNEAGSMIGKSAELRVSRIIVRNEGVRFIAEVHSNTK
jgi:hypothetical protein